jgi:hypothetical protein
MEWLFVRWGSRDRESVTGNGSEVVSQIERQDRGIREVVKAISNGSKAGVRDTDAARLTRSHRSPIIFVES